MDLNKLSLSDKIIGVSALVLLIASFLPWFKVSAGPFSATGSGWDVGFFWAGIPVILGLVMLAQVGITNFGDASKLPELPVSWGQVHLGAGALAAVIVVLKLIIGEDVGGFDVDMDRSFGLFLATIAALALAYGGFLKFQEEKKGTASSI